MRKRMTDAELKLWNALRAHRLEGLGFKRQMPIGPYIVDFACAQHKIVVELDGSQHAEAEQRNYDNKRTLFLNDNGWQVVRFWNDEVLNNCANACQHILAVLTEKGVIFK